MNRACKPIWVVIFNSGKVEWVAAYSLQEALSYFTEKGQYEIMKIEKTDNLITYQYP